MSPFSEELRIRYFSACCRQIPDSKQPKGGFLGVGAHSPPWRGTHPQQQEHEAVTSQEAERDDWQCSAPFSFVFIPGHQLEGSC